MDAAPSTTSSSSWAPACATACAVSRDTGTGATSAHDCVAWLEHVDEVLQHLPRRQRRQPAAARTRTCHRRIVDSGRRGARAQCQAAWRLTDGWFDPWAVPGFDPSALVKGWSLEEVGRLLEPVCAGFLVDAGGDLLVRGRPDSRVAAGRWGASPLQADALAAVLAVQAVPSTGPPSPRRGRTPAGSTSSTRAPVGRCKAAAVSDRRRTGSRAGRRTGHRGLRRGPRRSGPARRARRTTRRSSWTSTGGPGRRPGLALRLPPEPRRRVVRRAGAAGARPRPPSRTATGRP